MIIPKTTWAQVLSYQDLVATRPSLPKAAFCASLYCRAVEKHAGGGEVRYARVKGLGIARLVPRPKAGDCPRCGYAVFYSNHYKMLELSWATEQARKAREDGTTLD